MFTFIHCFKNVDLSLRVVKTVIIVEMFFGKPHLTNITCLQETDRPICSRLLLWQQMTQQT